MESEKTFKWPKPQQMVAKWPTISLSLLSLSPLCPTVLLPVFFSSEPSSHAVVVFSLIFLFFSLPFFLFLLSPRPSLSFSLSPLGLHGLHLKNAMSLLSNPTSRPSEVRGGRNPEPQLNGGPDASVWPRRGTWGGQNFPRVDWPPPVIFDGDQGRLHDHLESLLKIVPTSREESVRVIDTFFCVEMANFTS